MVFFFFERSKVRSQDFCTRAEQLAEKLAIETSGAKALVEEKGFIAALEALRHPKSIFQQTVKDAFHRAFHARIRSLRSLPFIPMPTRV